VHKLAVQVLKISLAWGDRFAADAQLKCPLNTPLPLPSYDLTTSECFACIPEIRFQVLSAASLCDVSSRNIFLGPFQGAPCWQIIQCRKPERFSRHTNLAVCHRLQVLYELKRYSALLRVTVFGVLPEQQHTHTVGNETCVIPFVFVN
jgi:hypothetical protein